MFGAILKATNSSFQKGMTFCRTIYVNKVMKLLAFIFEQPSYPLHHVSYAPAKFEVATSNGLGEDPISRNLTDNSQFHTKFSRLIPISSEHFQNRNNLTNQKISQQSDIFISDTQ